MKFNVIFKYLGTGAGQVMYTGKGLVHVLEVGLQLEGRSANFDIPFYPTAFYAFLNETALMIPYSRIKNIHRGSHGFIVAGIVFLLTLIGLSAFMYNVLFGRFVLQGVLGFDITNLERSMIWARILMAAMFVSVLCASYIHLRRMNVKIVFMMADEKKYCVRLRFVSEKEETEFCSALSRNIEIVRASGGPKHG